MVLNRRGKGDDGVSLIIVALSMVGVLGVAALVVDLGNVRQVRRNEQAAVDAAAVAAAQDLPIAANSQATRNGKQTAARNTAISYGVRNLVDPTASPAPCNTNYICTYSAGGFDFTVTTPWDPQLNALPPNPNSAVYIGQMAYINVQICTDTPRFFSGVLQQSPPRECRSAVGRYTQVGGGFDYGLVATSPSACFGLRFSGNEATTLTSNGAVMVNSNCSGGQNALNANNNSYSLEFLDAGGDSVQGYVGVVGGTSVNLSGMDPTVPTTGISPFGDPLGGLLPPVLNTDVPATPVRTCPQTGGGVIQPGYYVANCKVTSGDIEVEPGIYYLEGNLDLAGPSFRCKDSATAICATTGVFFYVKGVITINGSVNVVLPAYQMTCASYYTGKCWDGLTFWQTNSVQSTINGTSGVDVGTIYVPKATLNMLGDGEVKVVGLVVGSVVDLSGKLRLNITVPLDAPDALTAVDLGLEK